MIRKPPLGGFAVTAPGKLKRLLMSPGPIFEPEGHGAELVKLPAVAT